jgi:hypothetical protein
MVRARTPPKAERTPQRRRLDGVVHVAGAAPKLLRFGRAVDILSGGNHHPLLCELEDESGPAGAWVVKPQSLLSSQDARGALLVLAELAAAEVCAWAGIPTPAVGLVRFPEKPDALAIERGLPHLAADQRNEVLELYKLNRGALAFCGRLLEGAVDVMPGTRAIDRSGKAVTNFSTRLADTPRCCFR